MVKFKNIWLFERSYFQRFLNFIIAQSIAEIITKSKNYIVLFWDGKPKCPNILILQIFY